MPERSKESSDKNQEVRPIIELWSIDRIYQEYLRVCEKLGIELYDSIAENMIEMRKEELGADFSCEAEQDIRAVADQMFGLEDISELRILLQVARELEGDPDVYIRHLVEGFHQIFNRKLTRFRLLKACCPN